MLKDLKLNNLGKLWSNSSQKKSQNLLLEMSLIKLKTHKIQTLNY